MQGFNMGRYHAPSSLDSSLAPNASQRPARKLTAPPTIRFEMPFAIWCSTCPSTSTSRLIGQGVRFNAEKKKVGNYYSTPIWSFRMKHTACGGWLEIRTDPKSTEYIVTEGAKKRDTGDDATVAERTGAQVIGEVDEREKARQDAFAKLEITIADRVQAKSDASRIEELRSVKERDWRDVDEANRKLRGMFRIGRKERELEAGKTRDLQKKMSLGIDLLAETEEDRRRATFVQFGNSALPKSVNKTRKPLDKTAALRQSLTGRTRAALDPFGIPLGSRGAGVASQKRKRELTTTQSGDTNVLQKKQTKVGEASGSTSTMLVAYDSD
ncbi:hypothetical protein MRB53_040571 [Persea americana]|nr:hypothetical protein MRB53_040571 [Persea americana]